MTPMLSQHAPVSPITYTDGITGINKTSVTPIGTLCIAVECDCHNSGKNKC